MHNQLKVLHFKKCFTLKTVNHSHRQCHRKHSDNTYIVLITTLLVSNPYLDL